MRVVPACVLACAREPAPTRAPVHTQARIARLPPMERRKAEEKLQRKQHEKAMRKRTVKL